jgi:hypothetical protein
MCNASSWMQGTLLSIYPSSSLGFFLFVYCAAVCAAVRLSVSPSVPTADPPRGCGSVGPCRRVAMRTAVWASIRVYNYITKQKILRTN